MSTVSNPVDALDPSNSSKNTLKLENVSWIEPRKPIE